ncbi:MAG: hypothetical protein JWN87_1812 [Frankiales bacterium]|jgi:hypothetical protein|nr:hypothetical protein [Frankiales bacterium]MCW2586586.1 hypothetical protein [Frankiales bacterium]
MTTPDTLPRRPPGRYDEARTLPRPVKLGGAAVLGLLLLALTVAAYLRFAGDGTRFGTVGYRVLSDTAIEVRFQVSKDPAATVDCLVRARDRDGAEVGSEKVRLGPGGSGELVKAQRVATTHRAATGEVTKCLEVTPSSPPSP